MSYQRHRRHYVQPQDGANSALALNAVRRSWSFQLRWFNPPWHIKVGPKTEWVLGGVEHRLFGSDRLFGGVEHLPGVLLDTFALSNFDIFNVDANVNRLIPC